MNSARLGSAKSGTKDEAAAADVQSGIMTAYHDKLLAGPISLASARSMGRSVRRMQSHKDVKDAARHSTAPLDLEREEAAIDTLLTRETERLQAASALAVVARRHGGKLPNQSAQGGVTAGAPAPLDYQTLVRQELQVARGQAIVETEKRARRASVEMAEAAEAAARASIAESLRTGRPFTSQSAGRGSRRGSLSAGSHAGGGRRGSAASIAESVMSALEGGAIGSDLLLDLAGSGGDVFGDGRPTTATSSVAGRPYSGARIRSLDEMRALGTYGVIDPDAGRADPVVYSAADLASRPSTPGVPGAAMAALQGGARAQAPSQVPHLLVANFGTSKRRIFKEFARSHGLRVSVVTNSRAAIELALDRTQGVTAILADLTEGTAVHRRLVHSMQRELTAAGVGMVVQRDFAGAGPGALVPFIVACPALGDLEGDPEAASLAEDLLTCIDLGADCAIEKPLPLEQLAVRVRVLHARHAKAQAVVDQIRAAQAVSARARVRGGGCCLLLLLLPASHDQHPLLPPRPLPLPSPPCPAARGDAPEEEQQAPRRGGGGGGRGGGRGGRGRRGGQGGGGGGGGGQG